jgi:ankyrin repeat protein
VDAPDANGVTPFMRAAETGNLDVVKLLIAHGAGINATDLKGHSALQYAKDGRNKEDRKAMIRFLESQGLKK